MKVVLDHHVSPVLAQRLRAAGRDAVTTHERGWRLEPDAVLLAHAAGERRAVVTADVKDFVPIARAWGEEGRPHWGLVLVGQGGQLRNDALGVVLPALSALMDAHPADDAFRDRVHWL